MGGTISISRRLVALLRFLRRFSRVQLDPVIRNGSGKISRISVDTSLWRTLRSRLNFFVGQLVLPWNVSSARQCQSYPKANSPLTPFPSSNQSDCRTSRIPEITNNIILASKVQDKPQIGILRPSWASKPVATLASNLNFGQRKVLKPLREFLIQLFSGVTSAGFRGPKKTRVTGPVRLERGSLLPPAQIGWQSGAQTYHPSAEPRNRPHFGSRRFDKRGTHGIVLVLGSIH